MKIIVIVFIVVIIVFAVLYSNSNRRVSTAITTEELTSGRYWGDENNKREGTPDDWVLIHSGTRGAMWVSPENVIDEQ